MTKTCGNCGNCSIPGAKELEKAGLTVAKMGFCTEAMEYVFIDDKAEDWGCEDVWEPR